MTTGEQRADTSWVKWLVIGLLITMGVGLLCLIVGIGVCICVCSEVVEELDRVEDVELVSHSGEWEYGYLHSVRGTVKNTGDDELSYIQIQVKCYDEEDVLVGTHSDYVEELDAGETGAFEVLCYEDDADRYTISVESAW